MLVLLNVHSADKFTLKCFRAGRATAMTKSGASWQALQSAGEWRGMSTLSYVAPQAIDNYASIQAMVDASSDEEDE